MSIANLADVVLAAERTEIAVWSSVWQAAPPRVSEALGLSFEQRGLTAVFRARRAPVWLFNRLMGLGLEAEADRDQLRSMLESLRAGGMPHGVCVAQGARPPTIPEWLTEWGFEKTTTLARMTRTVDALPSPSVETPIRQVGRHDAALFGATVARGFGFSSDFAEWFASLPGREGWRAYLAYDAGRPIATGALFLHGTVGWLGFGSTLAEHRNRGVHRAMLARRMIDAADLGCRSLQTETNFARHDEPTPSLDNMRRLGFENVYARANYVRAPSIV